MSIIITLWFILASFYTINGIFRIIGRQIKKAIKREKKEIPVTENDGT
jgi:hypothetical protein